MVKKEQISTVPFKTVEKNLEYLVISIAKDVEGLCDENYKTKLKELNKEIEDIKKMEKFIMCLDG